MELKITKTIKKIYIIKPGQYYWQKDKINDPFFIVYNKKANVCTLYRLTSQTNYIDSIGVYDMISYEDHQKLLNYLLSLGIELEEE